MIRVDFGFSGDYLNAIQRPAGYDHGMTDPVEP
jgi:hypothetical protein